MRRLIGIILVAGAVVLAVILFLGGKLILPHVIGPATLVIIGGVLLVGQGKRE
jgi:hypothetical protein